MKKWMMIIGLLSLCWLCCSCDAGEHFLLITEEKESDGEGGGGGPFTWPVDCTPGDDCYTIGHADIDSDGLAYDCGAPGYTSHTGIDVPASSNGIDIFAVADGEVIAVRDDRYDGCKASGNPSDENSFEDTSHDHCRNPSNTAAAGEADGWRVCTPLLTSVCPSGMSNCYWCFGGNFILIKHDGIKGVVATNYQHLQTGSIAVSVGDRVTQGQIIAKMGSSGRSSGPHLHFEVWKAFSFDRVEQLTEPFAGSCGPNFNNTLWKDNDAPWQYR